MIEKFDRKFQGRKIKARLQTPTKINTRSKLTYLVELSNVPPIVTEEDLQAHLERFRADDIIFGQATANADENVAAAFIRNLLSQAGRKLKSFEVEPSMTCAYTDAYATFERALDIETALELKESHFGEIDIRLFVEHVVVVKIPVLQSVHSVIENKIRELSTSSGGRVRIYVQGQHTCRWSFEDVWTEQTSCTKSQRSAGHIAGQHSGPH